MAINDGCLQRPGRVKTASPVVYLMEELGDARLRCDQLVRYLNDAAKLVEKSPHKDQIFEVAGHLIHGIPESTFKLQKALQAVALAAAKIDYEELKRVLRPEKVRELEMVLEDVRIRQVQHRSTPLQNLTRKQAAEELRLIAGTFKQAGLFPRHEVARLIDALEINDVKTASDDEVVDGLGRLAEALDGPDEDAAPSRVLLASTLRRMLGDACAEDFRGEGQIMTTTADWKIEGAKKFNKGDIVRFTGKFLRNTGQVKGSPINGEVKNVSGSFVSVHWSDAPEPVLVHPENLQLDPRHKGKKASDDDKSSKFEEGKPADPTKNMSPEEAKEWKANTEKHRDKFKKDAVSSMVPGKWYQQTFRNDDMIYFTPLEQQKNKGFKGLLVRLDAGGRPQKAKQNSVTNIGLWKEVPEKDVPKDVMGKFKARMASDRNAKFKKGEPADPTQNMSDEQKAEWKTQNEAHRDKFKKDAGAQDFIHVIKDGGFYEVAWSTYRTPMDRGPGRMKSMEMANSLGAAQRALEGIQTRLGGDAKVLWWAASGGTSGVKYTPLRGMV